MVKNEIYSKRALNPERLNALNTYGGKAILDVGCGNGKYVFELADTHNIRGADYQSFEAWKERPELFTVADIKKLPFDDNSFDTLTLFEVLEHIPDPVTALRECLRVCRKNVIISVPNCDISAGMKKSLLTYFHYTDETHVNFFLKETLETCLRDAGFKIDYSGYINAIEPIHFFKEAYGLSDLVSKGIRRLTRTRNKKYFLTLLAVGIKS